MNSDHESVFAAMLARSINSLFQLTLSTMGISGGFYAAVIGGGVGGSLLLLCCIIGGVLLACRGKFQTGPERTRSLLYGLCFM
jgi:hypothetical protein